MNITSKKERLKLTPEQLFNIYLECNAPGAPVKPIEVKRTVVTVINNAVTQGLTQKRACEILGIAPRKFRRWANPKPIMLRTAWNKTLTHERDAIEATAWTPELIGKPVSHIFVHGHASGILSMEYQQVILRNRSRKPMPYCRNT